MRHSRARARPGDLVDASQHPARCRSSRLIGSATTSFRRPRFPKLTRLRRFTRAQAPSYITYGSHSAMFVGFTRGGDLEPRVDCESEVWQPLSDQRWRHEVSGSRPILLTVRNIFDGFNRIGFFTAGTGFVRWFDDSPPIGQPLPTDFPALVLSRYSDTRPCGRNVNGARWRSCVELEGRGAWHTPNCVSDVARGARSILQVAGTAL